MISLTVKESGSLLMQNDIKGSSKWDYDMEKELIII